MTEHWTAVPIKEEGYEGWDINYLNEDSDDRLIASIPNNSEQSIKDAELISRAPELLDMCKKCLSVITDSKLKKELEEVINSSESINENLALPEKIQENIFTIDFDEDIYNYIPEASIKQFILFEPYYDLATGSIRLNISGDSTLFVDNLLCDYSRPINYIMSKKNAKEFISIMYEKYKTLGDLVEASSKSSKNLLEVILDEFETFAEKYKTKTSLSKYLEKYPMVVNTQYEKNSDLLKYPRSIHSKIKITNGNKTIEGTLYLKEQINSFVIYNGKGKNLEFSVIKNSPEVLNTVMAEYIDLIDKPLIKK